MKILMISGDRNALVSGTAVYKRIGLQRSQVEKLEVVFWGRGSIFAPFCVRGQFDVVTVQDPFWRGLVGFIVARRIGAKLNVQVHTDLSAQSLLRHVLAQIVLRHADSVRVVSENLKKQVETIGVHASIYVLPIYIETDRFRNMERKPHEGKIVLWVGRFEAEKGPMLALSVFKKVRDSVDARLVMLGRGSLERSLRTEAKELPVEFPGWQEPAPYYAIADVVLSTSKHESYGASIIEALAAGVPVVAPDVGIAREAGATVVPREKLAEGVLKVLQSGSRGELKIPLLSKDEWAKRWKETL